MQEQALLAMATHHGAVTAADAARALGVDVAQADAALTALAKRDPDRMTVDVDDQGGVWYRAIPPAHVRVGERVRVPDVSGNADAEVEAEPGPVGARQPKRSK